MPYPRSTLSMSSQSIIPVYFRPAILRTKVRGTPYKHQPLGYPTLGRVTCLRDGQSLLSLARCPTRRHSLFSLVDPFRTLAVPISPRRCPLPQSLAVRAFVHDATHRSSSSVDLPMILFRALSHL
ncbi:uncharacterized protein PV07_07922 [Cladophialophora immunda]|uniref:Uncharacterized protein n=1 Tax=Cladophialophora immunda TaxID=569365 RepID=A0A0D2CAZ9_9EURO|nr:uncharacterized protein PV07_07922 [Cladophialophora immunda]KIW28243.1 hypothetical protein PV07_07922 [Cladophialophora immunda]